MQALQLPETKPQVNLNPWKSEENPWNIKISEPGYLKSILSSIPPTPYFQYDDEQGEADNALRFLDSMIGGPLLQPIRGTLAKTFIGDQLGKSYGQVISPETKLARKPTTLITKGLDLFQRGQYFSATFADEIATHGVRNLGQALKAAGNEFLSPDRRTSYSDVIKNIAPEFARNNPNAVEALGLLGDVYLDPLTYYGKVKRLVEIPLSGGKKALASKSGMEALKAVRSVLFDQKLKMLDDPFAAAAPDLIEILGMSKKTKLPPISPSVPKTEGLKTVLDKAKDAAVRVDMRQLGLFDEKKMMEIATSLPYSADPQKVSEIFKNIKIGRITLANEIPAVYQRETAERVLGALIQALPELEIGGKLVKIKNLLDKGGYKFGPITLLGDETITKLWKLKDAGIEKIGQIMRIKDLDHRIDSLGRLFHRYYKFYTPPGAKMPGSEFMKDANDVLQVHKHNAVVRTRDAVRKALHLIEPSRQRLAKMSGEIDDETRLLEKELGRDATDAEAAGIIHRHINQYKLNKEELNAYINFRQMMDTQALADVSAGRLQKIIQNYHPRYYEVIGNKKLMERYKMWKQNKLSETFTPDELRGFTTLDEARKLGYVPEDDIAEIAYARLMASQINELNKTYNKAVETFYGRGIDQLPGHIKREIAFVQDANFSLMPDFARPFLYQWDKFMNIFRKSATAAVPSFGVKQAASNPILYALEAGRRSLGSINPLNLIRAARIYSMRESELVDSSLLNKVVVRNPLKDVYTVGDIRTILKEHRVARGDSMADLNKTRTFVSNKIGQDIGMRRIAGNSEAKQGMIKLFSGVLNYLNYPKIVEDISNVAILIDALEHGHNVKSAVEVTRRALFDYNQGLAAFERQYLRRFLSAFYSFSRFSTGLLGRTAIERPGNIAGLQKATEHFFSAWNRHEAGEEMSISARKVTPTWILNQPNYFAGYDPELQATFRTFNSFSPLDSLNLIDEGQDGKIDYHKTFAKSFLAIMAPYAKIPFELWANEKYFTGQAIKNPWEPGAKVGNVEPEAFLDNLAMTIGGYKAGWVGAMGAKLGMKLFGPTKEDARMVLKEALGWEEDIDENGKRRAYVEPYRWYVLTSIFPNLNKAMRLGDENRSPRERAIEVLSGIGTIKRDLKYSGIKMFEGMRNRRDLLRSQTNVLREKGSERELAIREEEYRLAIEALIEASDTVDFNEIPGKGMPP